MKSKSTIESKIEKVKRKFSFPKVLAIISIVGFLEIVLDSMFGIIVREYMGSLWLGIMGLGFMAIVKPRSLFAQAKERLTPTIFSRLTTFVVGAIAILAGILAVPQLGIMNPALLAVKGIISIISIFFIIIETWVIKE